MLSTAADVLSLAQQAPWLAVSVLSLVASAWVYRQSRRALRLAEERAASSARRQGERLGKLEHALGLLDLRRRMTETEAREQGMDYSYWPPDGPPPPPARPAAEDRYDDGPPTAAAPYVPVPPLADDFARHRRNPRSATP